MSHSLIWNGIIYELMIFLPYFALLNPNSSNILQKRSKCSSKPVNWFFWLCRNWVDRFCSPDSSIQNSSKTITLSGRLCLWFNCSSVPHSFILIDDTTSKNFNFFCVLLSVANPSIAGINDDTRCCGLVLQKRFSNQFLMKHKLICLNASRSAL